MDNNVSDCCRRENFIKVYFLSYELNKKPARTKEVRIWRVFAEKVSNGKGAREKEGDERF